jgi:hypothetical protein
MIVVFPMLFFCETGRLFSHGVPTVAGKRKAFDSNSEVAVEEVFCIDATTPGMILRKEAIVGAEPQIVVHLFNCPAIVIGSNKCVCSPK